MKEKKLAKRTLLLLGIITVFAAFQIPKLQFNYDFEKFFPQGDEDLKFFLDYRQKFTPDTDFILVGLENETSVFNQEFLQEVERLTDTLETLPFTNSVSSPTRLKSLIVGPFGPIEVPYIHVSKPELYGTDSARIYQSPDLIGSFFSTDARAVSLLINTAPRMTKDDSDVLARALLKKLKNFEFYNIRTAGRMTGQLYYITKMQTELSLFISLSLIILIVFLWISFRSFWGVWVPIAVVLLTGLLLLAAMSLTGKPIDVLTAILPTILFVVGISDIVHIISRYLEELRNGLSKTQALKITFKEIGLATFLTSFTTAVGFLTLLTVSIGPIQEFGIYTSIGVFLAFFLAFTLLPAILMLNKKPDIASNQNNKLFWYPKMHWALRFTLSNRKSILIGSLLVFVVSLVGISRIEVDNFLLEDLSDGDPHKKDFVFFEKKFAGVRPFELFVKTKDSTNNIFNYDNVVQLNKVNQYLKDEYKAGFLVSIVNFVKTANQAMHGGKPQFYSVPETEMEYQKLMPIISRMEKSKQLESFIANNATEMRFTGKMEDLGGKTIKQYNQKFYQFLEKEGLNNKYEFKLTGTALLIDKNNETLAGDMMMGLVIAFLVIGFIMGFLYKSPDIVIIALIPNILPLLLIGGVMGFSGIDLKVSTSIIFTIAFGIAVDDTIHFMSKLKLELNKGKSLLYALKRTYISTGKAIVVTSIILCSGFISLVFSTFASTFYVGVLVSMTLLFAVLADLLLLPVLLVNFYKPKKAKPS